MSEGCLLEKHTNKVGIACHQSSQYVSVDWHPKTDGEDLAQKLAFQGCQYSGLLYKAMSNSYLTSLETLAV